jgi:putative oxidoreductase
LGPRTVAPWALALLALLALPAPSVCRFRRSPFDKRAGGGGSVMNILLWVLQVLLALAFIAHGWLFLSPPAELVDQMNATLPRWFQLSLGVAEVLAGVGLTLPGLTRILPSMVVWAAVGIVIVMVSATVFHLARGEMTSAAITLLLLGMAAFVAYMRYRIVPIPARRKPL